MTMNSTALPSKSKLQVLPIDYASLDGLKEDPILLDDERLARAAGLFDGDAKAALKDILEVMLSRKGYFIVHAALLEEFLPIRHEMAALDELWQKIESYSIEQGKRKAPKEPAK